MTTFCQKLARSPLRRTWVSRFRSTRLRSTVSGLTIGEGVSIGRGVEIETWRSLPGTASIEVGSRSALEDYVRLEAWGGSIHLAGNVHLGPFSVCYGHGGVSIGANTLIAMHCSILSSNHDIPPTGTLIRSQADRLLPTRIGEDVWIGAGATILGGVSIGDGAVIGAGSVVTSDIPPGAICVGSPARPVKNRRGAGPLPEKQ